MRTHQTRRNSSMSVYPEPYRPEDQPTQPQPGHPAAGAPQSSAPIPAAAVATTQKPVGKTKRMLSFGAVGVAGLVAGSALTFAVTANGSTTGDARGGPGSGQFGGPGGQ